MKYCSLRRVFHRFYHRHWLRFHPLRVMEWSVLSQWMVIEPGASILDVGCGNGYFARRVSGIAGKVIGIDNAWDAVVEAHSCNREEVCHFALADAISLPFCDSVFDVVIAVCALEHFSDDLKAASEIHRVMKPGGVFLLTVDSLSYRGISEKYREECRKEHSVVRLYTFSALGTLLERVGFNVLNHRYLFSSMGASFAYRLGTFFRWRGVDLLDPVIYPLLRAVSLWSDSLSGHHQEGYVLAALAKKIQTEV